MKFDYNKPEDIGDKMIELSERNAKGDLGMDVLTLYCDYVELNKRDYESGKAYSLGGFNLDNKNTFYDEVKTYSKLENGSYVIINEIITKINETDHKNFYMEMITKI